MASGKKTVGGVRVQARAPAPSSHGKRVGGVTPNPSPVTVESDSATLWKGQGYGKEDWSCPFGCEPTETPSAITHAYDCRFWTNNPEATPF